MSWKDVAGPVIAAVLALALPGCPETKDAQAQAPLPTEDRAPCIVTGCSGQVCADHDVVTTCEWRPEYACYKSARCERQATGECGWTKTPELLECLANPPP